MDPGPSPYLIVDCPTFLWAATYNQLVTKPVLPSLSKYNLDIVVKFQDFFPCHLENTILGSTEGPASSEEKVV